MPHTRTSVETTAPPCDSAAPPRLPSSSTNHLRAPSPSQNEKDPKRPIPSLQSSLWSRAAQPKERSLRSSLRSRAAQPKERSLRSSLRSNLGPPSQKEKDRRLGRRLKFQPSCYNAQSPVCPSRYTLSVTSAANHVPNNARGAPWVQPQPAPANGA